nr:hypothetical protein [Tanacetum cinerariifolium]GEZ65123.1 hypothetical protein [Tanacetum cinerariifolium]
VSVLVVVNQVMAIIVTYEPSYNQNYNDNYYPHELPDFPCCDNCGGSHETFQCQPIDQNVDFSGSNQIQIPQYPDVHPPSQENSEEDLIESALNSKLFLINSNSQRLDKKEQEVKNVVEQPVERGNRVEKSLQNFKVIHKSSISLNNSSQISPVHAVAPIFSTEEPEHSLSMGYEHLSITHETESNEVTESNAENLLPIPSECEVTSEDEIECDMPAKDDCSPVFTTFSNPLFNNDDLDSSNDESLSEEDVLAEEFKVYSNPLFNEDEINYDKLDPHCFNVESDFVESLLNCDTFIDSYSKFDFSGELAHINPEITESDFDFEKEIHLSESLSYDNSSSRPPEEHNADEERIKREHADYISRMEMLFIINPRHHPTVNANTNFESIPSLPIPVQDNDSQREEIDIIYNFGDEILVVRNTIVEFECIDARVNFDVSNDENDDLSYFMFVISANVFYFLSAESEDTIFDPGFAPHRLKFSCVGYLSRLTRSSHPFLEISLRKSISFDQYCLAVICRLYA